MQFKCNPITCQYCCGRIPQRVVLAIMLHLALQASYCMRVVLNVAIVEMVEPTQSNKTILHACPEFDTPYVEREGGKFPWPPETKSRVLLAFFIGYVISGLPGGWLADKFGGRYILVICVILSAISTIVFPILTKIGGHIVAIVLRAVLGIVQGGVIPVISSFVSTWIPTSERTLLGGISYGGSNLGTILGSIFTGIIIEHSNTWTAAFYFWSCMGFVYSIIHFVYVFSYPSTHPFIDEKELNFLSEAITQKEKFKTPWIKIFLNVPYWANIAAQFGHNYIFFLMVTWLPTYMKDMLQYDIQANGLISALPFLALWLSSLILSCSGNYLIHGLKFMTPHTFSKIFGTFSNLGSAALVLGAVFVQCNRELCLALYILGMMVKSLYYMTLPVNINELSKNYGGVMFGFCNSIGSLGGVLGSAIVGWVVKSNTFNEWKLVFAITLGIELVTSIIYIIWSSSERQAFDYPEEQQPEREE